MARSKMCESCVHTKVCMNDKNLFGDVFILGHPSFFDNEALYEEFKRREKEGFPCDDYMRIVRCKDCKHRDRYECNHIRLGETKCRATIGTVQTEKGKTDVRSNDEYSPNVGAVD